MERGKNLSNATVYNKRTLETRTYKTVRFSGSILRGKEITINLIKSNRKLEKVNVQS